MMTVKAVKSASQAKTYFGKEGDLEKTLGGYYTSDNAFGGGKWMGRGAEELGLKGAVGVHQFEKALEGHLPGGITIAPRSDGTHRPGNDCVFQAPKSFSLMALAAGDDRLIAVHDHAVEVALRWIEDHHQFARLGKGGKTHELTGKSVVAAFRHATARPVGGEVECHLHTHGVHINATQRADGKWVASNLGMDKDWEKGGGAVYRMEAALGAKECGYEVEVGKDAMFELAGVTRAQIEQASTRSQQIEAELAKTGKTRATATAAEKNAANLRTRESKKSAKLDGSELIKQWRENAEKEGFTRIRDEALGRVAAGPVPTDHQSVTVTTTAAIQGAVNHLSERESAFSQSALIGSAAEFGLGKVSTRDIEKALQKEVSEGRLLSATQGRFTTQQAISREQMLIQRIERGKDVVAPIKESVADKLTTGKGQELNDQQVAVAKHILTSPDRFVQVQGGAGVGKTTSMDVVCTEAKAAGLAVVGLAQTHKAKNGMAEAGIEEVKTIALAVREFRSGAAPENTIFIIDEASMASMKDVAELVRVIERTGNRAAVIGDLYQHSAVEAGSGFRLMQEHGATIELNEIVRQRNLELRECVHAFMVGDAARGAALAEKYMVEVPTEEIASKAAERFLNLSPEDRREALIVTGTNAMRKEVNNCVREGLKEEGAIGKDDTTIKHLAKQDLTKEQVRHIHNYQPGQVVQFQRDYSRGVSEPVTRDHQYEIKALDKEHNSIKLIDKESGHEIDWKPRTAGKVTISAQDELAVSQGDRVVFRANDKEHGIENGDHGTVKTIRPGGMIEVELSKGGTVAIDPQKGTHIEHAYSGTTKSLQSATCHQVIPAVHANSLTASAEQAYVGLSRARDDACIVTDDKTALIKAWSQWREKENATEVVATKDVAKGKEATQEKGQSHDSPTPDRARDQGQAREFSR
ncbi:MAG: MobF family relaxase [Acidithiobacillus sp.]